MTADKQGELSMMDIQAQDLLSAFSILIVCLAFLFVLFAVAAAIACHVIAPRLERRRLERLRAEIEREVDRALDEGLD